MLRLATVVVLAGTFLFSSGCCWPMWEGHHHRYGGASPVLRGDRYDYSAPRGRSVEDRRADRD
jgi:hypothetical protein